ncbi:uncharacterized protein LOC135717226 [Ochlerotatus camptorhynchus]|uniref:uncharacterized protein LOC135717226 n=1 Tax=Ochlerotatus camptorhynchus TaxID=644619 RepID=UPI0031DDA245
MPEATHHAYYGQLPGLNVPGDPIKTEPRDSPTHQFPNFPGTYRPTNESPSPIERSPRYGGTTPVGPTSPYNAAVTSITPTPGGYQPNLNNDFLLNNPQFQNPYNFATPSPTNGQPMYQQLPIQPVQQPSPHQFQTPSAVNNAQQFNLSNLVNLQEASLGLPGPSGVQPTAIFQPSGNTNELNLSSLLCMDSAELKSLMANISTSDIKQEQQRIQQEAETLSDSFTRLTTNGLNNLDK